MVAIIKSNSAAAIASSDKLKTIIEAMRVYYMTTDEQVQSKIIEDNFVADGKLTYTPADSNKTKTISVPQFEDPLMVVHGREYLRLQFKSLIKFFKKVDFTVLPDAEGKEYQIKDPGMYGDGSYDVIFRSKQDYEFNSKSMKPISLPNVTTTLTLSKGDDRILRHCDMWSDHESRVYRWVMKPLVGHSTSIVFKILGW
jgi:hypothetical protein